MSVIKMEPELPESDAERLARTEKESLDWRVIAEKENYRCNVCNNLIIKEEWLTYSLSGMCVPCERNLSKDD